MLRTVLILVNNPTHTLAPSTLPDRYPAVLPELDTERSALVFRCGLECFSLLFEEEGGTVKFAGEMVSSLWVCDFECLQRHYLRECCVAVNVSQHSMYSVNVEVNA
jgi:hypothetical protein